MLKIPKGLKKKKKGKKGKKGKEDELFDPEELAELERYKKEKQQKEAEAVAAAQAQAGEAGPSETGASETAEPPDEEEKEEWEKFKALTSGVDDILKKTQEELDRIKTTSYYQKKPPGPSVPEPQAKPVAAPGVPPPRPPKGKWVGFEEGASEEPEDEVEGVRAEFTQAVGGDPFEAEKVEEELEEEESEFEDDGDDLFDTSYVDVVASGEVKLAYVPDSPDLEDEGPDPFDTSIVDKVIKVDPQEEKKKKLVSLGCAVEVLTGKLEKPVEVPPEIVKTQRRRPRPRDLLLGSFDEGPGLVVEDTEPEPVQKSILDDDPVFAEKTSEILGLPPVTPLAEVKPISSPLPAAKPKVSPPKNAGIDLKTLVEEFVDFGSSEVENTLIPPASLALNQEPDEFDDEFAALAAESLHKTEKVKPPKPPPPSIPPQPFTADDHSDDEFNVDGDDPFDTTFATQVLPGKFELKLIEKEILHENIAVVGTNPELKIQEVLKNSELSAKVVNFESEAKLKAKNDLLSGSTSDLSQLAHSPLAPKSFEDLENTFVGEDPFDTSVVEKIVAPGKTELRFLEKELLTGPPISSVPSVPVLDDDEDFDPRAEEKSEKFASRPDNLLVSGKRVSSPKVVAFNVPGQPDLLAVDQEDNSKVSKPLTPYYPAQTNTAENPTADPFDTSYVVEASKPGKLEVQILEQELAAAPAEIKRTLSDDEFDPRFGEPVLNKPTVLPVQLNPDILSGDVDVEIKLHTPVVPQKAIGDVSADAVDPFDTSIASDLIPGKAEIKILETELIYSQTPAIVKPVTNITEELLRKSAQSTSSRKQSVDLVLEQDSEEITVKPLTPVAAGSFEIDDGIDPFDTSAVENILPGKTEIKLLESELLS